MSRDGRSEAQLERRRREGREGARPGAAGSGHADREGVRAGRPDEAGRHGRAQRGVDLHRRAAARHRARRRRGAARPHRRDLRAGVLRQDHARLPHHRRGPGARRRLRLRRHRARARPRLRAEDRRQHRRADDLPARLRRAGARDRRRAGALRRGRRRRRGLRRGADPAGGARGPDGRPARRPPGPPDVAGAAQAGRQPEPRQHDLPVHQPDPREDRRHVRLARRPSRAAGRSSSIPRSGSTSAGSRP